MFSKKVLLGILALALLVFASAFGKKTSLFSDHNDLSQNIHTLLV